MKRSDNVHVYRGFYQDIGHHYEGAREGSTYDFIAVAPERMNHTDWLRFSFFARHIGLGHDTSGLIAPARSVNEYIARNSRNAQAGIRWDVVGYNTGKKVRYFDVSRHEQPGPFERNLGLVTVQPMLARARVCSLPLLLGALRDLVPKASMQLVELPKPLFIVFDGKN